jgi:arabinose-5-phosphate isomerase
LSSDQILEIARRTIQIEVEALQGLLKHLDNRFVSVVELVYRSSGRVIVTGIGKSANIANKIVATLNSTGTPAVFMHAADAIHGDLGIVQKDDVVIAISKSGDTPEIKVLIPLIKNLGNTIVAMTGNADSYLGQRADYILDVSVAQEACPNNLAPTSSTTAQLVMGDALAVCLLEMKSFSPNDFARYHPGGALGKKLYLTVGDITLRTDAPLVSEEADIKTVIMEISSKRLGATAVGDANSISGVITDGDIRRMLQKDLDIKTTRAADIMTVNPKAVNTTMLAAEALEIMEKNNITQLLVLDEGTYKGIIHLHDIIKEGIL